MDDFQPVALFPLSKEYAGQEAIRRRITARLENTADVTGPRNQPGGSHELKGQLSSYIEIPNSIDARLDVKKSITILVQVHICCNSCKCNVDFDIYTK